MPFDGVWTNNAGVLAENEGDGTCLMFFEQIVWYIPYQWDVSNCCFLDMKFRCWHGLGWILLPEDMVVFLEYVAFFGGAKGCTFSCCFTTFFVFSKKYFIFACSCFGLLLERDRHIIERRLLTFSFDGSESRKFWIICQRKSSGERLRWYEVDIIQSYHNVGFALLNLTDDGLCESLEPWERVTRFPRFSF